MLHALVRSSMARFSLTVAGILCILTAGVPFASAQQPTVQTGTYTNPLPITIPETGEMVESCADPTILQARTPDPVDGNRYWYAYCTKDPLNSEERNADGGLVFHVLPIIRSLDLVEWEYRGDAFEADNEPDWWSPNAGIFAPDIQYINGRYYLYYTITDVEARVSGTEDPNCNSDGAIGLATSASPEGPWTDLERPVVEPRYNGSPTDANGAPREFGRLECNFFWTFDPEVITDETGQKLMYYGSYYGGIFVRNLSADGKTTDPNTATQITIANRYEGAEVVEYDGYYYLFVSASNCCNAELTGYSVFAGRATDPRGPFVDREDVPLLDSRVGGTPVLRQNGNRWIGVGHNSVFQAADGKYWTVYHGVDRNDPVFEGTFTRRPLLMDPIDWIDGWPMVRGGLGPSDSPQPAPAAQPGDRSTPSQRRYKDARTGPRIAALSDDFNDGELGPQWTWIREPETGVKLTGSTFQFQVQAADLFQDNNTASVLVEDAPDGEFMVETRVRFDVPPSGCCYNFQQAGLLVYGDDDNYVRLAHASIFETRQTEFGKEYLDEERGPRFGSTLVGPPSLWTYLRIVKRINTRTDEEVYTPYTSRDGSSWVRGGVWTHKLGTNAKIGLFSMGKQDVNQPSFTADFDYVRVNAILNETYLPLVFR